MSPDTACLDTAFAGMGIEQIQRLLPHRYPMLLVDRVIELDKGKRILAYKNITINEQVFAGHFPSSRFSRGADHRGDGPDRRHTGVCIGGQAAR